jgi:hypothetical protein
VQKNISVRHSLLSEFEVHLSNQCMFHCWVVFAACWSLVISDEHILIVCSQAYLVFHNQSYADATVNRFQQGPVLLDGRRLILLRWNPSQPLPYGNLFCSLAC